MKTIFTTLLVLSLSILYGQHAQNLLSPDEAYQLQKQINAKAQKQYYTQQLDSSLLQNSYDGVNWQVYAKNLFSYDYQGRVLIHDHHYYDATYFVGRVQYVYSNNLLDSVLSFIALDYAHDTVLNLAGKVVYTYNSQGLCIRMDMYHVSFATGNIEQTYRYGYEYDANGQQTRSYSLSTQASGTPIDTVFKLETIYQGTNEKIETVYHQDVDYGLQPYERMHYFLNGQPRADSTHYYQYNMVTQSWMHVSITQYSYSLMGMPLLSTNYTQSNQMVWEPYQKRISTYDANYNRTSYIVKSKSATDTSWIPNEGFTVQQEVSVPGIHVAMDMHAACEGSPFRTCDYYQTKPRTMLHTYNDVPTSKIDFHYSAFSPVNINQSKVLEAKVYPNPATDYINFDGLDTDQDLRIDIYDISGRKILSEELNTRGRLPVHYLQPGVYLFSLQSEKSVYSGKFIKQ